MSGLNASLLAFINAISFPLALGFLVVVGEYLIGEIWRNGFKRFRGRATISLAIYFSGEAIFFFATWWVRESELMGVDPGFIGRHKDVLITIGATIRAFGLLDMVRIWAPREWGHWPWIITASGALGMGALGAMAALGAATFLGIVWFFASWRGCGRKGPDPREDPTVILRPRPRDGIGDDEL